MQTEHLFELTYIILEKRQVTASEMAEHFGVSQRTIYRWVDALDLAGVPIITSKGKGGGIQLAEKYVLDKAVLTESEKQEILSSVQALQVLSGGNNSAVSKLKAITKANADWIQVDFAPWNPEQAKVRDLFSDIKSAILGRRKISMEYYSVQGDNIPRTVNPWKLMFRGQGWYLYGFCESRKAPRFFKLSRMQNVKILPTEISAEEKDFPVDNEKEAATYSGDKATDFIKLKVKVRDSEIYRIMDEYKIDSIEKSTRGSKVLTLTVPDMYWLKPWILSFGTAMKVLEPKKISTEIHKEVREMFRLSEKEPE